MSRSAVDWRAASTANYKDFCKKHPNITISIDQWKDIIYSFNENFRDYILETGEKARFPLGFGEFSINKKKREKFKTINGKEYVNLPIDWPKSREKHKLVYNFNFHTEGFFFGWIWFKNSARIKHSDLWYFKPLRVSSRLLAHYLKVGEKYQHIYKEWNNK
jgi:nucleoid DNA-binding protein